MVERRIRQARFPAVKSLDSFDFAIASLNKMLVLDWRDANTSSVVRISSRSATQEQDPSGGAKRGSPSASSRPLPDELMEARDEKRLLRLQKQVSPSDHDELGFVPLSKTGAELCSKSSASAKRGSILVTSNLPRY